MLLPLNILRPRSELNKSISKFHWNLPPYLSFCILLPASSFALFFPRSSVLNWQCNCIYARKSSSQSKLTRSTNTMPFQNENECPEKKANRNKKRRKCPTHVSAALTAHLQKLVVTIAVELYNLKAHRTKLCLQSQ